MNQQASGTFEVKMTPQSPVDTSEGVSLGRFSLAKTFRGDFEGTSSGEMLSARTPIENSAGYVAIERVTGSLQGRSGSFVLQHSGSMTRGTPGLVITVVPDSATGALRGLAGTMTIDVVDGKHSYGFTYTLQP